MQLRKLLLPGLLSVTLLSGCSLFNSEEDVVKMSPLPTVENQFTPSTSWSTSVGDGIGDFYSNLHPAFADGVVYAADRKGTVKALNADDGKEVWSVNLAEKDGWFSRTPALLSGGITVSGGHVYIGSEKAQLFALNTSDGTVAPATAYGAAIVGGDNGRVSAVLMQQGQIIWQQRISQATGPTEIDRLNDVDTTPVIVNGVVYTLAYNGNLTALDLRSGQIMWKRELGSVNDFIVDGNRIYLVDQNDRILALSTEGGVTLWTQSDLLHRLLTAPVLYNGNLVVGDSEGYMHWVNPEDGHFVAQQKVDSSGFRTDAVVADGRLLIQATDGTLYSITR